MQYLAAIRGPPLCVRKSRRKACQRTLQRAKRRGHHAAVPHCCFGLRATAMVDSRATGMGEKQESLRCFSSTEAGQRENNLGGQSSTVAIARGSLARIEGEKATARTESSRPAGSWCAPALHPPQVRRVGTPRSPGRLLADRGAGSVSSRPAGARPRSVLAREALQPLRRRLVRGDRYRVVRS